MHSRTEMSKKHFKDGIKELTKQEIQVSLLTEIRKIRANNKEQIISKIRVSNRNIEF